MKVSTELLLKLGAPILAQAVEMVARMLITEDNLKDIQKKVHDGVQIFTGKIPGEFDDMLVDDLAEAFSSQERITLYGDAILDPIEEWIEHNGFEFDDMLLPVIARFREVANIPDNDQN